MPNDHQMETAHRSQSHKSITQCINPPILNPWAPFAFSKLQNYWHLLWRGLNQWLILLRCIIIDGLLLDMFFTKGFLVTSNRQPERSLSCLRGHTGPQVTVWELLVRSMLADFHSWASLSNYRFRPYYVNRSKLTTKKLNVWQPPL